MPIFRSKNKFKLKRNSYNIKTNKHIPTKFKMSFVLQQEYKPIRHYKYDCFGENYTEDIVHIKRKKCN